MKPPAQAPGASQFAEARTASQYGQDPRVKWMGYGFIETRGRHGDPWLLAPIDLDSKSAVRRRRWGIWRADPPALTLDAVKDFLSLILDTDAEDYRPELTFETVDDALLHLLGAPAA